MAERDPVMPNHDYHVWQAVAMTRDVLEAFAKLVNLLDSLYREDISWTCDRLFFLESS